MIDLEGFKAFNFDEGVPYVSVTKNGVTFNKSVVMKLHYPKYVVLMVNDEKKQIAICPCAEDYPNSTSFFKENPKSRVISVRWNGKDLLNTLSDMMNWNLEQDAYRVSGQLLNDGEFMLFDLLSASKLK